MIKLQVIGNLGKDCITNMVNGKNVINFSLAHHEKFKDAQGNQKERTTWVDCAYWTDRTAIAPYLKKGTQVYVDGAPEVKTYQKNDGSTGFSLSLRVSTVQLLGSKSNEPGGGNQPSNERESSTSNSQGIQAASDIAEPVDDLPF